METDFANVEIHVSFDSVTVIWQDNHDVEWFDDFVSTHAAWTLAYSVYRYERRLHPDWVIALVY
jgi:hypothetical protein